MKIKSNQELKTLVEMLDDGDTIITNSDWDQRVEKNKDTVVDLSSYPFGIKKNCSTIRTGDKSIHVQIIGQSISSVDVYDAEYSKSDELKFDKSRA